MRDQRELRRRCAHPEGGHEPIPWEEIERPVHARFEQIVARWPDRWAVEANDARYTYAEFNRRANRIAHALRGMLPGSGEPVGILMPHGAAPLVAVMGVLKAGHIYLGLDPADPPLRVRQIAAHSGARVVLCTEATADAARSAAGSDVAVAVEELTEGDDEPGVALSADAPASLYYTSGSTGQPKGVLYTHRARMVTALRNTNGIRISRHDRLSLTYPTRYAGAANHTFGALLNGACVLPFDYAAHGAAQLAKFLDEKRITIYHSVPDMFRQAMRYAEDGLTFDSMRLLMLSSDSVYPSDLAEFSKRFPRTCLFSNSWGLSESPLFRPCFFENGPVTESNLAAIGCPLEDLLEENEVLLLDEDGREVADGETGEIAVRSRHFASGYWRDPEQTRARFVNDPRSTSHKRYFTGDLGRRNPDGTVVHLGRKDFQVQIGGERVEIGEIEAVLSEREDVRSAVVVAGRTEGGDVRLIAYVACVGEAPLESELREHVAERLPRQMTPDRFVFCDDLKLTEAGKMDRRTLPAPPRERPRLRTPFEAPATMLEREIAAIFGAVLELDGIGARDSFVELGGKSLGAMRVLAGIEERLGARVEFAEFFAAPTPVGLAATVELALTAAKAEDLLSEIEGLPEEEVRRLLEP
ncbi:MAG: non-ribosomal peptide synthetase [Bryobacteraceae bacterium]